MLQNLPKTLLNKTEPQKDKVKEGNPSPYCTCVACTRRRLDKFKKEHKRMVKRKYPKPWRKFSISKLLLDLLVTGLLASIAWTGYQVFILHQWSPIVGSIIFLAVVSALVWAISALRSRRYHSIEPGFKKIFFSLFGILLVLTFAGVEPLASYKNNILGIAGLFFLLLIILSPFIIWFILYFVIGPVSRIKIR